MDANTDTRDGVGNATRSAPLTERADLTGTAAATASAALAAAALASARDARNAGNNPTRSSTSESALNAAAGASGTGSTPQPGALAWVTAVAAGSAASATGSTEAATDGRIAASPGSADFAPQLAAQITTFVRDGLQHARLELNPGEMGPLTVQIQLDGNAARVHLAAEHAGTRAALEQAMPQLAGSLRENGLTLSGGGVFEQPRQPQQQQAQAQAGNNGNAGNNDGTANDSTRDGRNGSTRDATTNGGATTAPLSRRHAGVVDLVA